MAFDLTPLTAPALEPVTLEEAKAHLRVDDGAEDSYISSLIVAARQAAEAATGRVFLTQTFRLRLDAWPCDATFVSLPRPPLIAVTSVTVYDAAGDGAVWDSAHYEAGTGTAPGRLYLKPGSDWPRPGLPARGIAIEYSAGYGALASAVPQAIRQAILLQVGALFERREALGEGPASALSLLRPFQAVRL